MLTQLSIAQSPSTCTYSFETETQYITHDQVIEIWRYNSGSPTYTADKDPFLIIDVVDDWGFHTDGSTDNLANFEGKLTDLRNIYKTQLIVLYFPPGDYYFSNSIIFNGRKNLIIKGESAISTKIKAFHGEAGIKITQSTQIGIEDISILRDPSITQEDNHTIGQGCNIYFANSSDCWVSGVYSYKPKTNHIYLGGFENQYGVSNITITGCTFNTATNFGGGNQGYGVNFNGASRCRLENSLFYRLRHAINFQHSSEFNVVGYNANFIRLIDEKTGLGYDDNSNGDDGAIGGYAFDPLGDMNFHGRFNTNYGPTYNLIEGNRVECVRFDKVHGSNGPYNTFFRNYLHESIALDDDLNGVSNGYPYDRTKQHKQNMIGTVVPVNLGDITGTASFNTGNQAWSIPECFKSFYTYEKPDYLPDAAWPYQPGNGSYGVNGAHRRKLNCGNFEPCTVDPEGWSKYPCDHVPIELIKTNGQELGGNYITGSNKNFYDGEKWNYKARETITMGPATIKSSSTNQVIITAGNSITFLPGFSTEPGVELIAEILPVVCVRGKAPIKINNSTSPYEEEYLFESIKENLVSDSIPVSIVSEELLNQPNIDNIVYGSLTVNSLQEETTQTNKSKISSNQPGNPISIYPNPNNGKFNINFIYGKGNLKITDIFGKSIIDRTINSTGMEIDLSNYPSAIFLVKIQHENGMFVSQIVKQ